MSPPAPAISTRMREQPAEQLGAARRPRDRRSARRSARASASGCSPAAATRGSPARTAAGVRAAASARVRPGQNGLIRSPRQLVRLPRPRDLADPRRPARTRASPGNTRAQHARTERLIAREHTAPLLHAVRALDVEPHHGEARHAVDLPAGRFVSAMEKRLSYVRGALASGVAAWACAGSAGLVAGGCGPRAAPQLRPGASSRPPTRAWSASTST